MKKTKLKIGMELDRIMEMGTAYPIGKYEITDKLESVTKENKSLYQVTFTHSEFAKYNWSQFMTKSELLTKFKIKK